jgi:hypothetical protein
MQPPPDPRAPACRRGPFFVIPGLPSVTDAGLPGRLPTNAYG